MVKAKKRELWRGGRRIIETEKRGGDRLKQYQVTVCRFGTVEVEAESEDAAKADAAKRRPEEIQWFGEQDDKQPFLVTYAEPTKNGC